MTRPARFVATPAVLLVAALALDVAPAAHAQTPRTPAPQNPNVVVPMSTPSGARSPARTKLKRKGAVSRGAFRTVAAPEATAAESTPDAAKPTGEIDPGATPAGVPDADLLARALAMPENAEFRAWYEAEPEPAIGQPSFTAVPFDRWADDDACITRREGSTKFTQPGCEPRDLQATLAVDRTAAAAIESHFGLPVDLLSKIACWKGDGSCEAVEAAVRAKLRDCGILCTEELVMPDHQWIMDRSAPEVAEVARAVVQTTISDAPRDVTARGQVEALAGYVQAAVPYRTVKGPNDDLVQDGKQRCGLRTPGATLLFGGDCDSKSLLLASMIRSVDRAMPLALVHCMNGDTPHMILAVGCERAKGEDAITVTGTELVLVETTSDWGVGHVGTGVDLTDSEAVGVR
jgi:hypothetical protein